MGWSYPCQGYSLTTTTTNIYYTYPQYQTGSLTYGNQLQIQYVVPQQYYYQQHQAQRRSGPERTLAWLNELRREQAAATTRTADRTRCARTRARSLLFSVLDAEQRREFEQHRRFFVRGSLGRRYCIHAHDDVGVIANVSLVDDAGKEVAVLCAHPNGIPNEDMWASQKLALESDEDGFLKKANLHIGHVPELVAA